MIIMIPYVTLYHRDFTGVRTGIDLSRVDKDPASSPRILHTFICFVFIQ